MDGGRPTEARSVILRNTPSETGAGRRRFAARASARRAYALAGLAQLRAGYTQMVIRRTNGSLCRSEVILF